METLGTRLRKLRETKNLTQTELSELLGMKTYTTVSKWESNDNFPKGKDLKVLAEIFNVSSDYLLGLSEDKNIIVNNSSRNDSNSPIIDVYSQLNEQRKNEVVDFAKFKLQEQQKEEKNHSNLAIYNEKFNRPKIGPFIGSDDATEEDT